MAETLTKILKEIDFIGDIKEIVAMKPADYNIQTVVDNYMNNGMDKYEAMQAATNSLKSELKRYK